RRPRYAELLLERFEPLRRISDDESVPRLNAYARQLRDDEPFAALDAIDAHLVARERETFGERFSARDAALRDIERRVEDARRRVGERRLPHRQKPRRDEP